MTKRMGSREAATSGAPDSVNVAQWVACRDMLVCFGSQQNQKWCVRETDEKGPLIAVMLTKEVAHGLAAAPQMFTALQECILLIEDMSRFIGTMALQDYQRFNEAPIRARAALKKATAKR